MIKISFKSRQQEKKAKNGLAFIFGGGRSEDKS